MASSLVESLAGDFDPSEFHDAYAGALQALIQAKVSAGSTQVLPEQDAVGHGGARDGGEVIDLLAALQRSVDKAREARGEPPREAAPKPPRKATKATAKPTTKPTAKPTAKPTTAKASKKASEVTDTEPTTPTPARTTTRRRAS